jgi:hypothetical protein
MAKQTFTTGQVLTAAQMTSLQQTAMLGGNTTPKTTSYVLVAADAGDVVAMNSSSPTTITVNTSLFSAGDIVTIQNRGTGTCTITAGTATVNTSGSLVLAQHQGGILYFNSASAAVFYQWATPASGDIEGVTAGTGISGGGTSGTVTITNSMATAIDAKGDLIVGTGADTFARLAVGTNGHTLVADSATATGLKWAAPASGFVGCSLWKNGNQSLANDTATALTFNEEEFDTDGFHSTSVDTSRITIPSGKAGKYLFLVVISWASNSSGERSVYFNKNGSIVARGVRSPTLSGNPCVIQSFAILDLVANDYIDAIAYQTSGGSLNVLGTQPETRFAAYYLGA